MSEGEAVFHVDRAATERMEWREREKAWTSQMWYMSIFGRDDAEFKITVNEILEAH